MLPSHAFAGEVTAGKAVVVVVAEAGHGAYLLQCYNLLKMFHHREAAGAATSRTQQTETVLGLLR